MDGEVLAQREPLAFAREETLAVTFIKLHRKFSKFASETDVLGTRQNEHIGAIRCADRYAHRLLPIWMFPMCCPRVTSQIQILIQLESLILAQNERWRQA